MNTAAHVHMSVKMKSNTTAYVLWFFLGGLLIHRMYTHGFLNWLLCVILSVITGGIAWLIILIWDLFFIPSQVRAANRKEFGEINSVINGA